MFRSSVAAFYALPECLFYSFAGPVRRDRFRVIRPLLPIRSEVEEVVHWMPVEIQKKVFGPRWEHEIEKQGWPFWKRLMHRLQDCPICKPKSQTRKLQ
jgi:hypothetical protein